MKGKKRWMNLLLAVVIALALAVPLTALTTVTSSTPAEANGTAPYLALSKTASNDPIKKAGTTGTDPETTEVTLTVDGDGTAQSHRFQLDVVFAIDSSGSMSWNDPSGLRKTGAKNFIDKLDPALDLVGLIDWDSYVRRTVNLSSNFSNVKSYVDMVDSSGGTNLSNGLSGAISMLDTYGRTGSSKIIVFLTDGQGTYSSTYATSAANKGYVIYSIGLGSSVSASNLRDMANTTGGTYYSSPTAANLDAIYQAIAEDTINLAGKDIVVTEVLPSFIELQEDTTNYVADSNGKYYASIAPDSVVTDANGETTMKWTLSSDLSIGESWDVKFKVKSTQAGSAIPLDVVPDAAVEYTNYAGARVTTPFPQKTVTVTAPMTTTKTASPTSIWQKGKGDNDPYKTTITITVTNGTGSDKTGIKVIDVLQNWMNYENTATDPPVNPADDSARAPDTGYPSTDTSTEETTLQWTIDLTNNSSWSVAFDVSSDYFGENMPLNVLRVEEIGGVDKPLSRVEYGSEFVALPQAIVDVYPDLLTNKYADPVEIWKSGEGTPDESTVTLEVIGPGDDIVVTDVLQDYMTYLGNPTIAPKTMASGTADSGTATTLVDAAVNFSTAGVLPGMRITNTTENSVGIVTGVTTTTLTFSGGLSGGTDNAFEADDTYTVSYPLIDPDTGETTLVWDVGDLEMGQLWTVSFDVSTTQAGLEVPVDVLTNNVSKATYKNWEWTTGGDLSTAVFPQANLLVLTELTAEKSVSDENIWLIEKGTTDKTTVTLKVTGPGADVVVTEVLPDYLKLVESSLSKTPDTGYPLINENGETIIKWTVGSLTLAEVWQVTFDVKATETGLDLAVDVEGEAKVTYTNWGEDAATEEFNQAYVSVYAPLEVDKTATPTDLWKKGVGTPYKATVTLTVAGPGTSIVVTEILPDDITLEGEVTVTPDGGATTTSTKTMVWTVGELGEGEEWTVSYDVSSSTAGNKIALQTSAGTVAAYTAWEGVTPTATFPAVYVSVKAPLEVEVNLAPVYFAGLTAEAYILTTIGGEALDAEIDSVIIYYNDGQEYVDLTNDIEDVPDADGLFRVEYEIPSGADMGGYKMVVTASSAGLHGTSSGIFQVLTIPLEIFGYPIWIWGIAVVVVLFILMMIAVRIATMGRH